MAPKSTKRSGTQADTANNSRDEVDAPDPADKASYKRRRVGIACTSCRTRKSRPSTSGKHFGETHKWHPNDGFSIVCNGAKPMCSLCVQLGFECVYEAPSKAHDTGAPRQPKDYDSRLTSIENTLKLLLEANSRSTSAPAADVAEDTLLNVADGGVHQHDMIVTLGECDTDLLDESEDRVDGMATLADSTDRDQRVFGSSSNIALLGEISSLLSALALGQENPAMAQANNVLVSRMPSPQPSNIAASPMNLNSPGICVIPSSRDVLAMIEIFFTDTGMLFPFVSKSKLLQTYREAKATQFRSVRRSWLCLLNMVFAFATFTNLSASRTPEANLFESNIFFTRTQTLLAESKLRLADLELVQCLVLMCQYKQGSQRSDETWSLHGLAVYAAVQIGLNRNVDTVDGDEVGREMRKRTWFACLLLDSTLSMTLGRPSMIPKHLTALELPRGIANELTPVSSESDTLCLFVATIQLYKIQTVIIMEMYGNNLIASFTMSLPDALSRALEMEDRLDMWEQSLPQHLRLKPWAEPGTLDSSQIVFERLSVIMRLRFLHTKIMLYRAVLHSFVIDTSQDSTNIHSLSQSRRRLLRHCLSSCVLTATELIRVVHDMSNRRAQLGSGWFTVYYTFHAILVLIKCFASYFDSSYVLHVGDAEAWNPQELLIAADSLLKGREAIASIGDGSRSSKRICRSLTRMFRSCASIGASSHDMNILQQLLLREEGQSQDMVGNSSQSFQLEDYSLPFDGNPFDIESWGEIDLLTNFGMLEPMTGKPQGF